MNLPEGSWTIYIDGENAGTTPLGTAETEVKVQPISAMILVKEAAVAESGSNPLPALLGAMCAGLLAGVLVYKKKK